MAVSLGVNLLAYAGFILYKSKKAKRNEKALRLGFAAYASNLERANTYLQNNQLFYQSSLNSETRSNGLIIIEAYYGLDEHIYQVEARLLRF
jgi:hypothetical protein